MALTPEQIVSAIDVLHKRGETPTVRAVREVLGTGSLGTISRLMRERTVDAPATEKRTELPAELLRELREAFERQAREIREQGEEELRAERQRLIVLEDENVRLERCLEESRREASLRTEELQKGEGRLAELRTLSEGLRRACEQEREERIRAEKEASEREGERKGLCGQIEELRTRVNEATARIENLLQGKEGEHKSLTGSSRTRKPGKRTP
ncbi:MAG: DNA-binding protein [Leptospirales bacterium]